MAQDVGMQSTDPSPADRLGQALTAKGWRLPVLLFLVVFAVFGLTARQEGGSWDHFAANYASWHLVHEGDPWLDGSTVPGLEGDPEEYIWVREKAANGHTVVRRFPGVVAITLPAYWIVQSDTMTVAPAAITAAMACALGIMMLFLALRTRIPPGRAAAACLILALTTPVWTVAADAIWPHTVSVLGIGGMAWAASKQRWWLVGLFGGVILWGRLHAAIIVAVVGLLLGLWRRSPRITIVVGAVSAASLALVCVWTKWWIGSWNPISSYGADIFDGANTGAKHYTSIVTQMFSLDRGILVWSPVLLLLVPALVRGWREVSDWARALLLGGVAYTLVQAWIADPLGGDSFYGYRHGIELIVAATPALAMTAHRMGRIGRRLFAPLVVLQFIACMVGANVDAFVSKELAWQRNAFASALKDSWPVGPLVLLVAYCCLTAVAVRYLRVPLPSETGSALPDKHYEAVR
jgi:alpha-1,2-mannosyltransferase